MLKFKLWCYTARHSTSFFARLGWMSRGLGRREGPIPATPRALRRPPWFASQGGGGGREVSEGGRGGTCAMMCRCLLYHS